MFISFGPPTLSAITHSLSICALSVSNYSVLTEMVAMSSGWSLGISCEVEIPTLDTETRKG